MSRNQEPLRGLRSPLEASSSVELQRDVPLRLLDVVLDEPDGSEHDDDENNDPKGFKSEHDYPFGGAKDWSEAVAPVAPLGTVMK